MRANYELSIEELKDKRKRKTIAFFILEGISVSMMIFLLLFTIDIAELIISMSYGATLIVVLLVFIIVINVILFLYLRFHIDALDFARDRDFINLLIYLKEQEEKRKDEH